MRTLHGATTSGGPPLVADAEILADVLAAFRAPTFQPPVAPAAAIELLALARRPEARFEDIARVCAKDPLVAARVVRVAQSAHFSRGTRVLSLKDAAVRLGLEALAQLFLEVTVSMNVFRAPGYDGPMASLRRHSALTAHAARALSQKLGICGEHAFLCGLLHDVGVAAAAYVVGLRVPFAMAWPAILEAHGEAGRVVCRSWRMPAEIEFAVAYHHAGRVGAHLHPTLCVVAVAEWIATELGYGLDGEAPPARPETHMRVLGADDAMLAAVASELRKIAPSL
jgi:HD-like signal output (HDOD) protein